LLETHERVNEGLAFSGDWPYIVFMFKLIFNLACLAIIVVAVVGVCGAAQGTHKGHKVAKVAKVHKVTAKAHKAPAIPLVDDLIAQIGDNVGTSVSKGIEGTTNSFDVEKMSSTVEGSARQVGSEVSKDLGNQVEKEMNDKANSFSIF